MEIYFHSFSHVWKMMAESLIRLLADTVSGLFIITLKSIHCNFKMNLEAIICVGNLKDHILILWLRKTYSLKLLKPTENRRHVKVIVIFLLWNYCSSLYSTYINHIWASQVPLTQLPGMKRHKVSVLSVRNQILCVSKACSSRTQNHCKSEQPKCSSPGLHAGYKYCSLQMGSMGCHSTASKENLPLCPL